METPAKPERYNETEWDVLKDVAEPDEFIPTAVFNAYMRPVLARIIAFADTRGVEIPPIVEYLAAQSDENLQSMQRRLGATYLEMQLWCGDMKIDIYQRSTAPRD